MHAAQFEKIGSWTLLALLWVAFFFSLRNGQPIFTDDITYLMTSSRYLTEGGERWWQFASCFNKATHPVPTLWVVPATLQSLAGFAVLNSYLGFEWFTILRAAIIPLSALALLSTIDRPADQRKRSFFITTLVLSSAFAIGSLATSLVSGRPDGTLILCIIITLFLSRISSASTAGASPKLIIMLSQLALTFWGLFLHPQALVFTPLFAASILFPLRNDLLIAGCGIAALFLYAAVSYFAWQAVLDCPLVAEIERVLEAYAVRVENLARGPDELVKAVTFFAETPSQLLNLRFEESNPGWFIHELRSMPSWYRGANNLLIDLSAFSMLFSVLFTSLCYLALPKLREARNRSQRELTRLAAILLCCLALWSSLRIKNGPEFVLIESLIIISFLLYWMSFTSSDTDSLAKKLSSVVTYLLSVTLIVSIPSSLYLHSDPLQTIDPGRIVTEDTMSFYKTRELLNPELLSPLLNKCGINSHMESVLLLDEAAYFIAPDIPKVLLTRYVINWRYFTDWNEGIRELRARKYLLPCSRYEELRYKTRFQQGPYCCGDL